MAATSTGAVIKSALQAAVGPALALLALSGCASAVGPGTGSDGGALAEGGTTGPDAGVIPGTDAGVIPGSDGAVIGVDAGTRDTGVDPTLSLNGRWRLVGYDFTDTGGTRHLIDTNTPLAVMPGVTVDARVNGTLSIAPGRLALTAGVLANDHFFARDDAMDPATGLSASGVIVPGMLVGDAFVISGSNQLPFARNPDGTITLTDAMAGSRTTWARATFPAGEGMFVARGHASVVGGGSTPTLVRPRIGVAWDVPGTASYGDGGSAPMSASPLGGYDYAVTTSDFRRPSLPLDGNAISLAYVFAFEDVDGNMMFTAGDRVRGTSEVAIALREGTADTAAFTASPFRDLPPGYSLIHLVADATTGRLGIVPWDPTHRVAPDVAIGPIPVSSVFPDIFR